jgi:hypothetical protein
MKVKELYQVLYALDADGKGDCELIYEDTRAGDSGSISVHNSTTIHKPSEYDAGRLCETAAGTEYVSVYLDH